jgi:hypothetical protein
MRTRLLLSLLLATAPLLGDDVEESRRHQKAAMEAFQAKDHAGFLEHIRKASDLRPQHPTLLYQLAGALDRNGKWDEAIHVLERVASMGFVYDAARDFPDPRYAKTVARFKDNTRTLGAPAQAFVVDRVGMIPEGLAFDGKRFFVGSVRLKTIFAIEPDKPPVVFATAPYGVFGMVADPKRGILWATTSAIPQVEGFAEADAGKSALLKIDLASGKVLETLRAEGAEGHHFGDVALAPDGEVYVSDGRTPVVYRVRSGEGPSALEPFLRGSFTSLQGFAVSGSTLYVADYSRGLLAVDRRTGDVRPLRVPPAVSLLGIDGMYLAAPGTLIATQNGTNPNRIVKIELDRSGLGVTAVTPLVVNHPRMGDPTLGVLAKGRFYFHAAGQWDLFGEDGKIADPLKLKEAVVLSIPIGSKR